MLHTIIGLMNSGKTLFLVYKLFLDYCAGRKIYSNFNLAFPHTYINMDYLMELAKEQPNLENISFGLDELWIWLDSRKSQKNTLMTYFFNQSSKGDTKIYLSSQDDGQLDLRLRRNQHFLSICSRRLIINNEKHKINDSIRILPKDLQQFLYIYVKTYSQKMRGFNRQLVNTSNLYLKANPIFNLFNTHQKIKR